MSELVQYLSKKLKLVHSNFVVAEYANLDDLEFGDKLIIIDNIPSESASFVLRKIINKGASITFVTSGYSCDSVIDIWKDDFGKVLMSIGILV